MNIRALEKKHLTGDNEYVIMWIGGGDEGAEHLHQIIFYVDRQGKSSLLDYIAELEASKSKESRIKLTKIREYIKALAVNGTYLPEKYCKHLDGEIWELRPASERILFAGWMDGAFVLLHCFVKKTQKTPKREISQAKRELADFKAREAK